MTDLSTSLEALERADPLRVVGKVKSVVGMAVRASVPGARLGDMVHIRSGRGEDLQAEVVAFSEDEVTLMPLGRLVGVGPDDPVEHAGKRFVVRCASQLMGRVLNGLGEPMDGLGPLCPGGERSEAWDVMRAAPNPMARPRIDRVLPTGISVVDALLTVGEGQRVGLFAGSGVGKSSLLGQLARQSEADVFVCCLVGERGRELREFLDDALGPDGLARGVVVCATSDEPALVRMKSAYTATAIAEWFRNQGKRVLLLMDSVTRFARAGREVGLTAGEPPTRRGYPTSVFAQLPALLERAGTAPGGSITGLYTVLVEGGDMDEPIADEVRGILDGHVVLDRGLVSRGRFPAVDVLQSVSRVMTSVCDRAHLEAAASFREALAHYESKRDLVLLGAYRTGSDPKLDRVLDRVEAMETFLRQGLDEPRDFQATRDRLMAFTAEL